MDEGGWGREPSPAQHSTASHTGRPTRHSPASTASEPHPAQHGTAEISNQLSPAQPTSTGQASTAEQDKTRPGQPAGPAPSPCPSLKPSPPHSTARHSPIRHSTR